jgi:hypothetical protein
MQSETATENPIDKKAAQDYYLEGDRVVFTREYHLRRGYCCGSGCRHCPYDPRGSMGTTTVSGAKTTARLTE